MRIQDTAIWDDPLVRQTRENVTCDADKLNALPVMRVLFETGSADALTVATVIADAGCVTGKLPEEVSKTRELLSLQRVIAQGPDHLFKADDPAALKIIVATLVGETTGAGLDKIKAAAATDVAPLQKGFDILTTIADRVAESGAWRALEPDLLDKFAEGINNVKAYAGLSSRQKVMAEAARGLKSAIAQGSMDDITARAPRIDPTSQYEQLKPLAKSKLKL